jgi:glycosyltransferase involved in cell wall biosynthesis
MREALRRVDVFFAHGPGARATVIAHGLPPERVREGVSPVAGTEARPAPGLPSPRIVFAGRLNPDKGPDILVEALRLLRDPPPTLILGDGRMRAALQRRVPELGLTERVTFYGWVADPGPYIAGATVLAIPSRDESFSQTAIIGLAHGVPVIGTDVDGFPATLGGGRGILVAPDDPQALAAALQRVLGEALPRPRPLRGLAERHAPARVAAMYASTYCALVASGAAGAPHRELGQDRLAPGAGRAGAAHLVAGRDDPSGAGGRLRRGGRPAAPAGRRVRIGLQHARAGSPPKPGSTE